MLDRVKLSEMDAVCTCWQQEVHNHMSKASQSIAGNPLHHQIIWQDTELQDSPGSTPEENTQGKDDEETPQYVCYHQQDFHVGHISPGVL